MKEMVGGCCVCSDERGWSENPLVYCDGAGCNVAVHQACYGIISVPTGPWFCRKCESQERTARVKCELCPLKEGALKRTDTGGWCHVVCALFIPEAWFGNVQTMEPIILKGLPPERFNKPCYICEEQNRAAKAAGGACMQCNKNGCKHHFHVTCAQAQGLLCEEAGTFMDNVKYCGYCSYHYKKLKKDSHIKVIPAFKPIQPDNITPQSSPDKVFISRGERLQKPSSASSSSQNTSMPKTAKMLALITEPAALLSEQGKEKCKTTPSPVPPSSRPTSLPTLHSTSSSSSGSDSEPYNSPPSNKSAEQQRITDIKATGKFTTANFTETTITPSPANFGDIKGNGGGPELEEDGSERQSVAATADKKPGEKVSDSGLSSSLSSDSGENDRGAAESQSAIRDRKDLAVTTEAHSKPSKLMPSSTKTGLPPGGANVNAGSVSQPSGAAVTGPSASYTYSYENFLHKNYPGGSTGEPTADRDLSPDKVPAKRARSRSSDKKRNKRTKADKPTPPTGPKPAKDLLRLTSPNASPPHTMDIKAVQIPDNPALKKPLPKKKKDTALGFGLGGATAFGTTPVSVASLQKHGAGSDERLSTNQHGMPLSATPPPPGLVAETLATSSAATVSGNHDLADGIVNGPSMMGPSSSHKTLTSPSRVAPDNNHAASQLPTSMEQLLERQWDQGSHFLMEQGQHFDIASLLNCLHQLRQENQRLEDHIASLSARRDQLLAVNARLSLPLTPALVHPTPGAAANSQDAAGHSARSPRINNFLPPEGATVPQDLREVLSRNIPNRSPGQAQSPAQNHLTTPTTQSPASQVNASSNHTSPAGRGSSESGGRSQGDSSGRSHSESGGRSHGDSGGRSHGDSSGRNHGDPGGRGHSESGGRSHGDSGGRGHGETGGRSHISRDAAGPPILSAAVSSAAPSIPHPPSSSSSERHAADHQRLLLHQHQMLLGSQLPPEMQQQLMLQMLHQQQVAAVSSTMTTTSPLHTSQAQTKSVSDKTKEKT